MQSNDKFYVAKVKEKIEGEGYHIGGDTTVIGNDLVLTENSVSGFSTTSYLSLPKSLRIKGTYYFHFRTPSVIDAGKWNTVFHTQNWMCLEIFPDGRLITWDWDKEGYEWGGIIILEASELRTNTDYWVKMTYIGDTKTVYVSMDGVNYEQKVQFTDTGTNAGAYNYFYIGQQSYTEIEYDDRYWEGLIYLNDCRIEDVNGNVAWQGDISPNGSEAVRWFTPKVKKVKRKYYKIAEVPYEQPVLTDYVTSTPEGDVVASATSEWSGGRCKAWEVMRGEISAVVDEGYWQEDNQPTASVTVQFPKELSISKVKVTSRPYDHYFGYITTKIGNTTVPTRTETLAPLTEYTLYDGEPITANSITLTVEPYGYYTYYYGLQNLQITATHKVLVESTEDDYDIIIDEDIGTSLYMPMVKLPE